MPDVCMINRVLNGPLGNEAKKMRTSSSDLSDRFRGKN